MYNWEKVCQQNNKNIKGPGRLKKKENKMENVGNSEDEIQHGLQKYS